MAALPRRWSRVAGFVLFGAAGAGAALWPTPSVRDATGSLVYVWATWLIGGGLLAAIGSATDRWIGEYLGLPLLAAAFAVYAVVLASTGRPGGLTAAAVLGAVACIVWARWRDIDLIRREATRLAQRHQE
nr:hypothetical protein [Micromonospora sp. DSM 115978]